MLVCFQLLQCDVDRLRAEESGDFINRASNTRDVGTAPVSSSSAVLVSSLERY